MSDDRPRVSLWWDQVSSDLAGPARAALDGDIEVDVAIVGAGFTGLWTAYYLQRLDPSRSITLIEAEVAGFGASGRNGGWCSALFPASLDKVASISSRDDAVRLWRTMHRVVDEVGEVAEKEGIDAHFRKGGTVVMARTDVQAARAAAEIVNYRSWGFGESDYALLGAAATLARVGGTCVVGGTYTPHCAAIHPANLVRGLARVVESHGAAIFEHTRATEVGPGVVRTERGTVRARHVIRATEGYTAGLEGHRRALMPLYSSMIATEPLPTPVWDQIGLDGYETFTDERNLVIYGQRTPDGRLAFGGRGAPYHFGSRVDPAFDHNTKVSDRLRSILVDLFPVVSEYAITHTWGGPLGVARDWFPSVTFDPHTGFGSAGGYVGDGVASANLAGQTLADLIVGQRSDLITLPWVQHRSPRWEPEPMRFIGANGALWLLTSADTTENRTGRTSRRGALIGRLTGH